MGRVATVALKTMVVLSLTSCGFSTGFRSATDGIGGEGSVEGGGRGFRYYPDRPNAETHAQSDAMCGLLLQKYLRLSFDIFQSHKNLNVRKENSVQPPSFMLRIVPSGQEKGGRIGRPVRVVRFWYFERNRKNAV